MRRSYVYQKYFDNCSRCEGKTCIYSNYIILDYHSILNNGEGCPYDTTLDSTGGYFYAWKCLYDNHNFYLYLDYNVYGSCYWSCLKYWSVWTKRRAISLVWDIMNMPPWTEKMRDASSGDMYAEKYDPNSISKIYILGPWRNNYDKGPKR